MKTTEVFIEQVLIGFLVLAIGALPFQSEILSFLQVRDSVSSALSLGAVSVGVAYLCGVVFDRYADIYLDRFVKHLRARFAIECFRKGNSAGEIPAGVDPFPEDQYRILALSAASGVQDWFHYLRSGIRLSRALVLYMPGVTLAGVMAIIQKETAEKTQSVAYIVLAVAYLGAPLTALSLQFSNFFRKKRIRSFFFGKDIPRTDESKKLTEYGKCRALLGAERGNLKSALRTLADICVSLQFFAAVLIGITTWYIIGTDLGQSSTNLVPMILALVGSTFTCLAAATWVKVERTYMNYHAMLRKYSPPAAGAR